MLPSRRNAYRRRSLQNTPDKTETAQTLGKARMEYLSTPSRCPSIQIYRTRCDLRENFRPPRVSTTGNQSCHAAARVSVRPMEKPVPGHPANQMRHADIELQSEDPYLSISQRPVHQPG